MSERNATNNASNESDTAATEPSGALLGTRRAALAAAAAATAGFLADQALAPDRAEAKEENVTSVNGLLGPTVVLPGLEEKGLLPKSVATGTEVHAGQNGLTWNSTTKTWEGARLPYYGPHEVDVRECGADGVTPSKNTKGLREAAQTVREAGGGVVHIPFMDFPVKSEPGEAPMLGKPIEVAGTEGPVHYKGLAWSGWLYGATTHRAFTNIRRAEGTGQVFQFEGSETEPCEDGWSDLQIDGGGTNDRIGTFSRCNELNIPYLKVVGGPSDNVDYGGIRLEQVYNTRIGKMTLYHCGGAAEPAMMIGSRGETVVDSLMIGEAKFEACRGTEMESEAAKGVALHAVTFGTLTGERELEKMSWTVMKLLDIRLHIGTLVFNMSPTVENTSQFIHLAAGKFPPEMYVGNLWLASGGNPASFIEHLNGYFHWGTKPRFSGKPTNKYLVIGNEVAAGRCGGPNPDLDEPAKYVEDKRVNGANEPLGCTVSNVAIAPDLVNNSTAWALYEGEQGVSFPGSGAAADGSASWSLSAPAESQDFGVGTKIRVRFVIPSQEGKAGNENVRLGATLHTLGENASSNLKGKKLSEKASGITTQTVKVEAIGAIQEAVFVTVAPIYRGGRVSGTIKRFAHSEAGAEKDNYTGPIIVIDVDIITNC